MCYLDENFAHIGGIFELLFFLRGHDVCHLKILSPEKNEKRRCYGFTCGTDRNYLCQKWKGIGKLSRLLLQDVLSLRRRKSTYDLMGLISFLEQNTGMTPCQRRKGMEGVWTTEPWFPFAGLLHLVLTRRRGFLLMLMTGHLAKR